MTIIASTAIAAADHPYPELAAEVVHAALAKSGTDIARSVLLLLSGEFARHAQPAVSAASRAAHCLQVVGCTATGVFTEENWILDRPAAAAMVLAGDAGLSATAGLSAPAISLATPERADTAWLRSATTRIGLLSSGSTAQEPGRVWCHGKLTDDGRCDAELSGVRAALGVSRGIRSLGSALRVTATEGHELLRLDDEPAVSSLRRLVEQAHRAGERIPEHSVQIAVLHGPPQTAIAQGRFTTVPVVSTAGENGAVTLGVGLAPGDTIMWVLRDPRTAERNTRQAVDGAIATLRGLPDFALVFSCMGRGPYFFGHTDEDLECLKRQLPGVPLLGAYGCGEIASTGQGAEVLHNSAVIGLFRGDV